MIVSKKNTTLRAFAFTVPYHRVDESDDYGTTSKLVISVPKNYWVVCDLANNVVVEIIHISELKTKYNMWGYSVTTESAQVMKELMIEHPVPEKNNY